MIYFSSFREGESLNWQAAPQNDRSVVLLGWCFVSLGTDFLTADWIVPVLLGVGSPPNEKRRQEFKDGGRVSLIDREPSQGGGVVRFPGRWQCDTLLSRRDAGQKTGVAGAQPWNPLNRQSPLSRFDPISVSNRRLLRYR